MTPSKNPDWKFINDVFSIYINEKTNVMFGWAIFDLGTKTWTACYIDKRSPYLSYLTFKDIKTLLEAKKQVEGATLGM